MSRYDARASALSNRLDTATILGLQLGGGRVPVPVSLNGQTDLSLVQNQILAPGTTFDSGDLATFGNFGSTFDILDRTVLNLHGIPIDDGSLLGVTVPYDIQFVLDHKISNIGGSVGAALSPIVDRTDCEFTRSSVAATIVSTRHSAFRVLTAVWHTASTTPTTAYRKMPKSFHQEMAVTTTTTSSRTIQTIQVRQPSNRLIHMILHLCELT